MNMIKKQYEVINGTRMAYVEYGSGDPIIFLHGNPTSSYIDPSLPSWKVMTGNLYPCEEQNNYYFRY